MDRTKRSLLVLTAVSAGVGAIAAQATWASSAVTTCGKNKSGYVVYASGVSCPTAKRLVTKIGKVRYRGPKITITGVRGYLCVATYNRRTKKMKAGSCLRRGTVANGFGWTKDGAQVPLPPGVTPHDGDGS